jgi:hypothetical protein
MRNAVLFFRYAFVATRFCSRRSHQRVSWRIRCRTFERTHSAVSWPCHDAIAMLSSRETAAPNAPATLFYTLAQLSNSQRVTKTTRERARDQHDPSSLRRIDASRDSSGVCH